MHISLKRVTTGEIKMHYVERSEAEGETLRSLPGQHFACTVSSFCNHMQMPLTEQPDPIPFYCGVKEPPWFL